MTAGGGLDVRVHRHFAIRIIQAEYLMTRFQDYTTGTTRDAERHAAFLRNRLPLRRKWRSAAAASLAS